MSKEGDVAIESRFTNKAKSEHSSRSSPITTIVNSTGSKAIQDIHNNSSGSSDDNGSGSGLKSERDLKFKKLLNDPRFQIRPLQQVMSACTGAMITACFMTPLDVIKTRMQAPQPQPNKCFLYCNGLMDHLFSCCSQSKQAKPEFRSTLDALAKISRNEGLVALWSGLGPTLVSALPSTVVYFVAYEQFKARYISIYQKHLANIEYLPNSNQSLTPCSRTQRVPLAVPMLAGVTARVCAVTFVSPIELIRTKMQSQRMSYGQVMRFVRNVIEIQGITGLWRGLPPTILRDVPFSGIYWPVYEYLKICFCRNNEEPSFGFSFMAGTLAGSVAALATCPFDVVKTHEQIEFGERVIFTDSPAKEVDKKSTYSRLLSIYKTNGLRGLFAGYAPRLFKVAPACAIMISTFEYSKLYFFYYNVQQHNEQLLLANPNAKIVKDDDIG